MSVSSSISLTNDFSAPERLALLQGGDHHRVWRSLDDRRICVRCTRVFSGHEVEITKNGSKPELHCPTADCDSWPLHWLFCGREPGTPGVTRAHRRTAEVEFSRF